MDNKKMDKQSFEANSDSITDSITDSMTTMDVKGCGVKTIKRSDVDVY
jgi:hypothetical protein